MAYDLSCVIDEYRKLYPPLIDVEQAAEIAHAPKATIHGWSSAGHMDGFKVKKGRRVLFGRDEFVSFVLSGNPDSEPCGDPESEP